MISIDARFDALAAGYLDDMKRLVKLAVDGRLGPQPYANAHAKLAWNTIQAAYLLGGGELDHGLAQNYLRDARKIARASSMALAGDLFNGRYQNGGLDARLMLWVYTVAKAYQFGMILGSPRGRFVWRIGRTEEHCRTCLFYDGVEMMGWEWLLLAMQRIFPQGKGLECEGWRCDCLLKRV